MQSSIITYICTKGRYFSTLPLTLSALINQSLLPKEIIIYDDNDPGDRIDLRENEIYKNLFLIMNSKNIGWSVVYGQCKGQHYGHQYFNEKYNGQWLFRCDDDVIPDNNVIKRFDETIVDNYETIGAVGGSIITPTWNLPKDCPDASNKIEDIFLKQNEQWYEITKIKEVDHLHCSYCYKAGLYNYNLNLSKVAHREESIHSYGIKKSGHKVFIIPDAISYHFKSESGGIRDGLQEMYEHDESIFLNECFCDKFIILDNGIGDHIVFSSLLEELIKKYNEITISCCYPEVFKDYRVRLISIEQAKKIVPDINDYNIYKWMSERNWNKSLQEAFKEMYQ